MMTLFSRARRWFGGKRPTALTTLVKPPLYVPVDQTGTFQIGGHTYQYNTPQEPWSVMRCAEHPDLQRFEVRSKDNRNGDPADRERSEYSGSKSPIKGSGETWLAYPMVIESYGTEHWLTLYQAFGVDTPTNTTDGPVLKLEVRDGKITEINIAGNNKNTARAQKVLWQGTPLEKNKLYNFVWRMKFDGVNGELDLWVNGIRVIEARNIAMGFGADAQTYHKYGIYRDTNLTIQPTCIVTYGFFERANGVNGLQHRIMKPLLMPYYSKVLSLGLLTKLPK